jgi:lipopolysaccharide transport system permease protein
VTLIENHVLDIQPPVETASASLPARPLLEIEARSRWAMLNLLELWRYRDLLYVLAGRDVKLRYRQTALGVAWVVLQPLMAAGIFTFVFGKVLHTSSDGVPYFIFSFAGLLAYNAFSGTVTKASACIVGNAQLVSKVYFPRLILPLSTVFGTLIDFAIGLVLLIAMMIWWRVAPGWGILLLPLWLSLIVALAVGLGLFTSALMVRYRDLQYVIPVLVQLVLYISPIGYPVSAAPENLRIWFYLNPLTGLIEAFRWSALNHGTIDSRALIYSAGMAVLSVVIGTFAFKKLEGDFADVI